MSEDRVLPQGSWYVVVAVQSADICGPGEYRFLGHDEAVKFLQFYFCADSVEGLLGALPMNTPRALWLLPSPGEGEYLSNSLLRKDLVRAVDIVRARLGPESDGYFVLSHNSIESVLRQIGLPPPAVLWYRDSGAWRLWRTETQGLEAVFISPRARGLHKTLEHLLEGSGAKCQPSESACDDYLLAWLASGEGF